VPFAFVTEGVEHAVELAKAAAGEKNVTLMGGDIVRQALTARLLDEIHLDLVPILLGEGVRLFGDLTTGPVELALTRVVDAPGVTHLSFRVVK
jgi:dihydrofolate reductase